MGLILRPKTIVIIAVLFVIGAAAGWYVYTKGNTPFWETPAQFGDWNDQIQIEYTDGTTDSLKIIQAPMTVLYNDKEIKHLTYTISAVESKGNATVTLDCSTLQASINAKQAGNSVYTATSTNGKNNIRLNPGETKEILKYNVDMNALSSKHGGLPNGNYTLTFQVIGACKYQAQGTTTWTDVSLPPERTLSITVSESSTNPGSQEIVIDLHGTASSG